METKKKRIEKLEKRVTILEEVVSNMLLENFMKGIIKEKPSKKTKNETKPEPKKRGRKPKNEVK